MYVSPLPIVCLYVHMDLCVCTYMCVYVCVCTQHITDPHIASASLDVAINNPLSQEQDVSFHIEHTLVTPPYLGMYCLMAEPLEQVLPGQ